MTLREKISGILVGCGLVGILGTGFAGGCDAAIHKPSQKLEYFYHVERELNSENIGGNKSERYFCLKNEYTKLSANLQIMQEKRSFEAFFRRTYSLEDPFYGYTLLGGFGSLATGIFIGCYRRKKDEA